MKIEVKYRLFGDYRRWEKMSPNTYDTEGLLPDHLVRLLMKEATGQGKAVSEVRWNIPGSLQGSFHSYWKPTIYQLKVSLDELMGLSTGKGTLEDKLVELAWDGLFIRWYRTNGGTIPQFERTYANQAGDRYLIDLKFGDEEVIVSIIDTKLED